MIKTDIDIGDETLTFYSILYQDIYGMVDMHKEAAIVNMITRGISTLQIDVTTVFSPNVASKYLTTSFALQVAGFIFEDHDEIDPSIFRDADILEIGAVASSHYRLANHLIKQLTLGLGIENFAYYDVYPQTVKAVINYVRMVAKITSEPFLPMLTPLVEAVLADGSPYADDDACGFTNYMRVFVPSPQTLDRW